jgi:two-component system NtrC family sensor kinase
VLGVIWTVRPLRRLALGVRQLGRGDWAQRVAVDSPTRGDEVSQLAREFNQMAAALQERERRLIRGERLAAVGQLAAQVTHEIRNPLSSVALNVELLADEIAATAPEAHQLLAKITSEIDRLTSITEDYLGFVRRKNPERVPLDLSAELTSLLDFMAEELAAAGVRVVRDLPHAWVLGDAGQLRQAFMNLLRNAREALVEAAGGPPNPLGDLLDADATDADLADLTGDRPDRAQPAARPQPGSACITVRLERLGDRVRAVVADNGPGLAVAADEAEHIFEAFFTRKPQGTGLGLSIVQQIVQDHEGSVRVAATGPLRHRVRDRPSSLRSPRRLRILALARHAGAPPAMPPSPPRLPGARRHTHRHCSSGRAATSSSTRPTPTTIIRCKNTTECEKEESFFFEALNTEPPRRLLRRARAAAAATFGTSKTEPGLLRRR